MFDITDDPRGFKRLMIAGKIDEDEMRAGLDAFFEALPETGRADFLYMITDFEFPALQALMVEFGYLPRLFGAISRVGKVAVVADAEWIRKWAEIEGAVIPGLNISAFRPDEAEDAETWLIGEQGDHMPM